MITQAIKAVVKVLPKVSFTLFMLRLKTCATCPSRITDPEVGWTCGKYLMPSKENKTCGCMVREKAKLKGFNCPQKKWPKQKKK
jgi:hypothetical protein